MRGDHLSSEVSLVKAPLRRPLGRATLWSIRTTHAQESHRVIERQQELALLDQVLDHTVYARDGVDGSCITPAG